MQRKTIFMFAFFLAFACVLLGAFAEAPNIGLTYSASKYAKLQDGTDPQSRYRAAIEENGGVVVVLSQSYGAAEVDALLGLLDGVLLPGGIDVDPRFYDEERHERLEKTDAELDALEFKVLVYADAHSLPVLGVCRGHQVLNVHAGGSLIQDIPTEHAGAVKVVHRYPKLRTEKREHAITVTKGSVLHQLLGAERIVVNTYHHQAVKRLAPGLTTSARTDDGVVEAIERPGDRFVLGVQFHPERMRVDDGRFDALFQRLVEEARDAHARRVALRQEAP